MVTTTVLKKKSAVQEKPLKNGLTLEDIENCIDNEESVQLGVKTVAVLLTLKNGFEVVGTAACVDVSVFDFKAGEKIARQRAVDQIWLIEGYRLQCEAAGKASASPKG